MESWSTVTAELASFIQPNAHIILSGVCLFSRLNGILSHRYNTIWLCNHSGRIFGLPPLWVIINIQWLIFVWTLGYVSRVWLFATPWTVAYQAPQSMEFSRREYWGGLPLPSKRFSRVVMALCILTNNDVSSSCSLSSSTLGVFLLQIQFHY